MKKLTSFFSIGLLLLVAAGCKRDSDATPESDSLVGNWRLTKMACFCAYNPNTVEILTLDANQHFRLVRDGQLAAQGTYAVTQGSACANGPLVPYLQLTVAAPTTYAPYGVYTVQNNTLTIERCVALDGPSYTYQRVP
ncbi:MAG: hypothetical protein ACRYFZ_13220 [Janthinobacterium lividum]